MVHKDTPFSQTLLNLLLAMTEMLEKLVKQKTSMQYPLSLYVAIFNLIFILALYSPNGFVFL